MQSGTYEPIIDETVICWNGPDKDGDGDIVYYTDELGRRNESKDPQGNVLRSYLPPAGFANFPSSDGTPCWVKVDERGQAVRDAVTDETIQIAPGQCVVIPPHGKHWYLNDDYERAGYLKSRTLVPEAAAASAKPGKGEK